MLGRRNVIDVMDYGAVGDGVTNDRVAIQNALDAAIAAKLPLVCPPGTFYVEFDAGHPSLRVAGDVVVVGSGPGTILKVGPEAPSFIYYGFHIDLGVKATIHNLTMQGPTDAGPNERNNVQTSGVFYDGPRDVTPATYTGWLKLERVQIMGNFYTGCLMSSGSALVKQGTVTLEIRDCDITAYTQAVCAFTDDYGYSKKRLHAYSSNFHDGKLPLTTGHLVYVHPSISIHFENCHFSNIGKYSIHHFGSTTTLPLDYAHIWNCEFGPNAGGVLTSRAGLTEIRGCTFRGVGSYGASGVVAQASVIVDNCLFDSPNAVGTYGSGGLGDKTATVSNCQFMGSAQNRITYGFTGGSLVIKDGHWTTTYAGADHIHPEVACALTVDNCRFNMPNAAKAIWVANPGRVAVKDCRFEGKLSTGAISVTVAAASVANGELEVLVDGCEFLHDGRAFHLNITGGGIVSNLIREQDSTFRTTRGIMWAEAGVGVQMLSPKRVPTSSPVASASAMNLDHNSDTAHISGSAAIQTVTLGGCAYLWGGARINLVVDSPWALGTLGNVVPKHTTARTPGEIVGLLYDGGTDKWREL